MPIRAVVLLSGGLDSQLAVRILQEQEIEVEALNFKTAFTCCQDQAGQTARDLGVRLTVVSQEDDYFDLVKRPRFGRGKGANPCVDCRIYMFRKAEEFMRQVGAHFIASGEVVGQRPMSQKRSDLDVIAYHADLDGLLLRPLSAKLLPPTIPEKEGWVDRERLYGIAGRGRKNLLALAKRFGLKHVPSPSTGCALTEVQFSKKVFDVLKHSPRATPWEFELLKLGRHFRYDRETKVIVGRREEENAHLEYMHHRPEARACALLTPANFPGPTALVVGPAHADALEFARRWWRDTARRKIGMMPRYAWSGTGGRT
jgi:tRNA-uridine 2-sulfurtransferase